MVRKPLLTTVFSWNHSVQLDTFPRPILSSVSVNWSFVSSIEEFGPGLRNLQEQSSWEHVPEVLELQERREPRRFTS